MDEETRISEYQPWSKIFEQLGKILDNVNSYIRITYQLSTTEQYITYGLGFHDTIRPLFIFIKPLLNDKKKKELKNKLRNAHNTLVKYKGRGADDDKKVPKPVYLVVVQELPDIFEELWELMHEHGLSFPTWSKKDDKAKKRGVFGI